MSDLLVYIEPSYAGVPVWLGMFTNQPPQWQARGNQGQVEEWIHGTFALDLVRSLYPGFVFDGLRLPDGRVLALDVVSTNLFWERAEAPPFHQRKAQLAEMVSAMMRRWSTFCHWSAPPIFTPPGFLAYHPEETARATEVWGRAGHAGVQIINPDTPYSYPDWWRPNKERT